MRSVNLPKTVTIVDVSPRDGLQSEPIFVPTHKKVALISALVSARVPKVEVTSFVSPKWVPQLADAEEVMAGIAHHVGTSFQVLILNEVGYERARTTGLVREVTLVVAATETLNRKNVNMSVGESLRQIAAVTRRAKDDGLRIRCTIGVAFVCPYEGRVSYEKVIGMAERLFDFGADEVALADTLGAATPDHVYELFARARQLWPDKPLAGHFHDTHRLALSNIEAAMRAGVDIFDTAASGLGGCQFTKGARGNVATERVVLMLDGMGVKTGIDREKLTEARASPARCLTWGGSNPLPRHDAMGCRCGNDSHLV